jgi:hypothetical protein
MHTPSPLAPRRSPAPGVIPEPVQVVDGTLGESPDRRAAPGRSHALADLVTRLLRGSRTTEG